MTDDARLDRIDADTKLAAVLKCWPHLLGVLRELSPAYGALDDAFLRQTFGRVASLRQVARAGGVPVEQFVARLAAAAGVDVAPAPVPAAAPSPAGRPPWAREEAVVGTRDARVDLAGGVHPLPFVIEALEALPPGGVFALTTPLVPAPVMDLARRKGFEAHAEPAGEGVVRTFFRRAEAPDAGASPAA